MEYRIVKRSTLVGDNYVIQARRWATESWWDCDFEGWGKWFNTLEEAQRYVKALTSEDEVVEEG